MIKLVFIFGYILLLSTSVLSETSVFSSRRGFMFPDSFESASQYQQLGAVFQNPAELARAQKIQISVHSTNGYFSYDYVGASLIVPVTLSLPQAASLRDRLAQLNQGKDLQSFKRMPYTFGFGLNQFGNSELLRSTGGENGRGVRSGELSDTVRNAVIGLAYSHSDRLDIGFSLKFLQRTLAGARAEAYMLDFGLLFYASQSLSLGVYSANAVHTDYSWSVLGSNSDLRDENLDSLLIFTLQYLKDDWKVRFSSDLEQYRVQGSWELSPIFSIISDVVYSDDMDLKRYGYGTRLFLGGFALEYFHTESVLDELNMSQDSIAIAVSL